MWKFILGLLAGAVLSLGYVRYNLQLPEFLQIPGLLKGNIVSTATETELYALDAEPAAAQRALEVYFANRAQEAAAIDADAGHPFLAALHHNRAVRASRQLSAVWSGFDDALALDALRQTLEQRHGTSDTQQLKEAMLWEKLQDDPWLAAWLEQQYGPQSPATLPATLVQSRQDPR